MNIQIRDTTKKDLKTIYEVEYQAFNEPDEADLAEQLLNDPTTKPLSLLAYDGEQAVGHILFTKAAIKNFEKEITAMVLAPLAIIPAYQKMGIGGQLIQVGLERLKMRQVDIVFVLGHIDYYPQHGFEPALRLGFVPPFPTKKGLEDAWMVQALSEINLADYAGQVTTSTIIDKPENW